MGCLMLVHVTTTVRSHLSECWDQRMLELLSEQYCLNAKQITFHVMHRNISQNLGGSDLKFGFLLT